MIRSSVLLVAFGLILGAPRLSAAATLLTSATDITSDSQVAASGNVFAFDFNGADETVNGVAFTGSTTQNDITLTVPALNNNNNYASGSNPSGLSSNFVDVLNGGDYDDGDYNAINFSFDGLTANTTYDLQLFVYDSRSGVPARSYVVDVDGTTDTLTYGGGASGPDGQYDIFQFTTPDGTTSETFSLQTSAASGGDVQLNAVSLDEVSVPEPSTYWLMSVAGMVGVAFSFVRRRLA